MHNNIRQAADILCSGGLVAFPTETVYGLGADPRNPDAVKKVFAVKGRPLDHPLIVHISSADELENWAVNIPAGAFKLARHFWPGPLTIVLDKHPAVSSLVTGGQQTIAIRAPNHPLTLALLQHFGHGIVGPSANSYGRLSPTTAAHVAQDLGGLVDCILDGGPCAIGIESTIVHFLDGKAQILRQGNISSIDISNVLGKPMAAANATSSVRVPGSSKAHYAPRKPLFLIASDELQQAVASFQQQPQSQPNKYGYLCWQTAPISTPNATWIKAANDPVAYAKNLYAILHQLDANPAVATIVVEAPPQLPAWSAVQDRLTRASVATIAARQLQSESAQQTSNHQQAQHCNRFTQTAKIPALTEEDN